MLLLSLNQASLAFGHVPLLDAADFQVNKGERVALIGRNGCGKSSMLAALAGCGALDDGEVWRESGLRLGYVAQEPVFDPQMSVFEAVVSGMGETSALLADYHAVSHQLAIDADATAHDALLHRLHELQEKLESRGAWSAANLAERAIERFSLDAEARVGTLSGGQKKRLALAQALSESPDLLLLDEPTNHLDIAAIAWLETMLVESGVTLVFITHDRYFLDRLATRVVELDRGRLTGFPGNYAEFERRKAAMLADEAVRNARFDKFLAQEEVWIRKGVEARRTRNEGRVLRLEQLRRDRAARRDRAGQVELALARGDEGGRMVAELFHVNKTFTAVDGISKTVVSDFSCRLMRGDRVGLIGPNGAGKTTLLRLILGEIGPDSGTVRQGNRLNVAYFDQFRAQLDEEATLADIISPGSEYVEIGNRRKHVIGYLEDFLFAPERARSPVRSLSGGERNRLLLARLFARPANVLVLDEPTNDLDIDTLELLEQLLQDYDGTIFLVSHDRTFLDNVVTQTLVAEGEGIWREHAGGYSDWAAYQALQDARRQEETKKAVAAASAVSAVSGTRGGSDRGAGGESGKSGKPVADANRPVKLSYKEARELESLPGQIHALEEEQKQLSAQLEDPALHSGPPEAVQRIAARLGEIDEILLGLLERWEELESKQAASAKTGD